MPQLAACATTLGDLFVDGSDEWLVLEMEETGVTGLELVVGWLAAYAWGKARLVAGRADAEVNRTLGAGMDRLHDLISTKLGADPALARLEAEAGRDVATVTEVVVNDRTRQRVQLSLDEATESDPGFAADLAALIAELRQTGHQAAAASVTASHTGQATALGGVAISGAVGGNVSVTRP
jgi:hypothetical protein